MEEIERILDSNYDRETKLKNLENIQKELDFAKEVIDGKMKKCKQCNEYYNSKSFFVEEEIKDEKIMTYCDPINSGGNEYKNGKMKYIYQVCPKNHKTILDKYEM